MIKKTRDRKAKALAKYLYAKQSNIKKMDSELYAYKREIYSILTEKEFGSFWEDFPKWLRCPHEDIKVDGKTFYIDKRFSF